MNDVTLRQHRQRELRQTIPDYRTFQLAVIDHPITSMPFLRTNFPWPQVSPDRASIGGRTRMPKSMLTFESHRSTEMASRVVFQLMGGISDA
jgi:hypothetical protein